MRKKDSSILIVLPNDHLGGAEQLLKNIGYFFSKEQRVIFLFLKSPIKKWNLPNNNIELIYSNKKREINSLGYLSKEVFRITRNYNIQFTFTSHTHTNGFLGILRLLRILKTDYFVVRESTVITRRFKGIKLLQFKFLYYSGYWFNDLVICQTSRMRRYLLDDIKFAYKWNLKVINNPINLEAIKLLEHNDCEISNEDYIIAAGRLIKLKGFDILIKAYSDLKRKGFTENLYILGEGAERENLEKLVDSLNLNQSVRLLGFKENPIPYFSKAKIAVVSSIVEGFPNVLLQMMSQCNRVVSTKCAGDIDKIPSVVTCQPNSVNSLAIAMEDALINNNEKINRIAFDTYLASNNIEKYLDKINYYLNGRN